MFLWFLISIPHQNIILGVKESILQICVLSIFPVSWSQKRRMNYSFQKTSFFHFHFPFGGKDKMDWEQQDGHFFLLGHFAYSIRVRTLVLETLSHILLYLLVSISIILYCIVLYFLPVDHLNSF